MTQIISILNHKGGVGKTTSVVNIGAGLHALGKHVLLVDLDPQANLTLHMIGDSDFKNIYEALRSKYGLPVYVIKPGLDIVPSTLDLAGAELELQGIPGREYLLQELILPFVKDYDFILIDCPPSLGFLSVNALTACTYIIIPVECSAFSLKGMTKLFNIIDMVKYRLNKAIQGHKVLITKYDSRKTIQRQIAERIQTQKLSNVYSTVIRTNVALEEASMSQCSVYDIDKKSTGAIDYLNICREILNDINI